jgi:multidrug resistance efflux pump
MAMMDAQLERWSARIDVLVAAAEADARTTLGEHQRLDELRAGRVIAQARLVEFRVAEAAQRKNLEPVLGQAWSELAVAMRRLKGR